MSTIPWEEDFQYSPLFAKRSAVRKILDFQFDMDRDCIAKPMEPPKDLEPYLADLYRYPVLSRESEKMLFLKMNYAKYRATRLKQTAGKLAPLQQRHIRRYIKIAQDTRNILARHNLRLVVSIAKKVEIPGMSFAEVISNGNMHMLKCLDKFNPSRRNDKGTNNKFSTYATWAIRSNLNKEKLPPPIKYRQPDCIDGDVRDFDATIRDYRQKDDEPCEPSFDLELMLMKLNDPKVINERERDILTARYAHGLSKRQISERLGITKEWVRALSVMAKQKVKAAVEAEYAKIPPRVLELLVTPM